MKRIDKELFKETYYFEELTNGLKVYINHKQGYNTTTAALGTPFGALDIHASDGEKRYDFNPGIAHFIEHKLFEDPEGDVLDQFAKMGAYVNAMTSYSETVYYFTLTGKKHLNECLDLLLDFTQRLTIDEESVAKEKPIIIEEVKMYEQMPDARLIDETYKCLYHNYPLIYDIGGDEASVKAISLDELNQCYKLNYHPSNMILCITTFEDPDKIMNIIKSNQNRKSFSKIKPGKTIFAEEPLNVKKSKHYLGMDVNSQKHVYAIKCNHQGIEPYEIVKKEKALRFALQMLFSNLNPDYQGWLDEGLINYFFGYDVSFNPDASYIMFYCENNTADNLKSLVDKTLRNARLTEEKLTQLKRRYIGNYFAEFNDVENYTISQLRYLLDDLDIYLIYDIVSGLTINDLQNEIDLIDMDNYSLITLGPKMS